MSKNTVRVLTEELMIKENSASGKSLRLRYNSNAPDLNAPFGGKLSSPTTMKNSNFKDSEGYQNTLVKLNSLMDEFKLVKNAADFDEDRYYKMVDMTFMILSRNILQQPDLTSFFDTTLKNPNFTEAVMFKDFLPWGAIFDELKGDGDEANQIHQQYGGKESTNLLIHAVGWQNTLLNKLFNQDIFKLELVLQAVAEGYVAKKNDLCLGNIFKMTFAAGQKQAPDTTGATIEEKMYKTMFNAYVAASKLYDPLSGDRISMSNASLLINPVNVIHVNRAINGGSVNKNGDQVNRDALPIKTIVPYDGKTIYNGKKHVKYAGCPLTKAYLFIPGARRYSLEKVGLTQQVTPGDAGNFTSEKRGWYFCGGNFYDLWEGSSNAGAKAKFEDDFPQLKKDGATCGYVLEITLPSLA